MFIQCLKIAPRWETTDWIEYLIGPIHVISEDRGAGFAITGIGITLSTFFPLVEANVV